MLIFQHLVLGLSIGIICALLLRHPLAIAYSGFGAILPDLIDKPLGYMVLGESLNWGRIYAHTLPFALIICAIGIICIIKNRKKILLLCVGIGCISHQITDSLKFNDWMYPFTTSGHMPTMNPILFCVICIVVILLVYFVWERYSIWCVISGVVCCLGIAIWYGIMGMPSALSNYIMLMLPNLFPPYEIVCLVMSGVIIAGLVYIMRIKPHIY